MLYFRYAGDCEQMSGEQKVQVDLVSSQAAYWSREFFYRVIRSAFSTLSAELC